MGVPQHPHPSFPGRESAQVRLVSARGGEGDLFCRQQLGKHPQPLQTIAGALASVAALVLGSPIWQNQPPPLPKGPCSPCASVWGTGGCEAGTPVWVQGRWRARRRGCEVKAGAEQLQMSM